MLSSIVSVDHKKSTSKSTKSTTGGPDTRGYDGYVRLRTMIDSLECGSIRYYLQVTEPTEKRARFKKLETDLMPIVDWLWQQSGAVKRTTRVASFAPADVVCQRVTPTAMVVVSHISARIKANFQCQTGLTLSALGVFCDSVVNNVL